jgi:hypothetical protein
MVSPEMGRLLRGEGPSIRRHGLEVMHMDGKYDAPEPEEETRSKGVGYLVLGLLVVGIMILIATGVVPIYDL